MYAFLSNIRKSWTPLRIVILIIELNLKRDVQI